MRIDLRWTPLIVLLAAACTDIPDPQTPADPSPGDGGSMPPDQGDEGDDEPSPDPPAPPPVMRLSCQVAGQTFPDGSLVPSADGCSDCSCVDGDVVCTEVPCSSEGCDLYLEAPDGVCSRPADDPCITQDPDCSDTEPEPEPEPEELACDVAGQTFPSGAEVPSGDSCNTCGCDDGSVSCTESSCDPVFCAEFVEDADGVCARFPLDPCIAQDPDCGNGAPPVDAAEPTEPTAP
jgi:hypothetical protein